MRWWWQWCTICRAQMYTMWGFLMPLPITQHKHRAKQKAFQSERGGRWGGQRGGRRSRWVLMVMMSESVGEGEHFPVRRLYFDSFKLLVQIQLLQLLLVFWQNKQDLSGVTASKSCPTNLRGLNHFFNVQLNTQKSYKSKPHSETELSLSLSLFFFFLHLLKACVSQSTGSSYIHRVNYRSEHRSQRQTAQAGTRLLNGQAQCWDGEAHVFAAVWSISMSKNEHGQFTLLG